MREVMIAPTFSIEIDSFEDGVFKLIQLQERAYETLQSIKEKQKDLVRQRFEQGAIISTVVEISNYGDSTIEQISQATGIGTSTLYAAKQFYQSPRFGQSMFQLEAWFEDQESKEKPCNWSRVRNMLKEPINTPEAKAADIDRRAKILERKAQEIEFEAEEFQAEVEEFSGSDHVREQALGVATQAVQIAREKRDQIALMVDAKPERITDEKYLQFIRTQPCCVTGMTEGIQPHHFLTGGMGTKGSDYATVPLHHELHRHLHDHGQNGFQESYDISFKEEMARLMHLYFVGMNPWTPREQPARAA